MHTTQERWGKLRAVVAGARGISTLIKSREEVLDHLAQVQPTPDSDIRDQGDAECVVCYERTVRGCAWCTRGGGAYRTMHVAPCRLYSLDNMLARDQLREHPAIVGDINRVRRAARHARLSSAAALTSAAVGTVCAQIWELVKPSIPGSSSFAQRMSYEEYLAVYKRIMTVVCPELTPAEHLASIQVSRISATHACLGSYRAWYTCQLPYIWRLWCVQADWDRDRTEHNVAHETLSHRRFFGSLFELADIWCEGVTWEEYHEFLRVLYNCIAKGGQLLHLSGTRGCRRAVDASTCARTLT